MIRPLWSPCERQSPGRSHRRGRGQEILPPPHYCRISVVHFFFLQSRKKKAPSKPCGSKGAFGGDCWTRTSDLLRVKIRLDIKGLLLGAFRYFWLPFFRTAKRSLSTVSTRCYPDIGKRIGQIPGSAHCAEPGPLLSRDSPAAVILACNQENVK